MIVESLELSDNLISSSFSLENLKINFTGDLDLKSTCPVCNNPNPNFRILSSFFYQ